MRLRTLVVDDSEAVLDGLCRFLSRQSSIDIVGVARDGEEAVREAVRLAPDLVVMDVEMPKLNGIEAARQIKRLPRPPFVVLTSFHASPGYSAAAAAAGADGWCDKTAFDREFPPTLERLSGGRDTAG